MHVQTTIESLSFDDARASIHNMKSTILVINLIIPQTHIYVIFFFKKGEASPSIHADWVNGGWF